MFSNRYIKECITDFNNNNKEYYNSLKISDNLYKKYLIKSSKTAIKNSYFTAFISFLLLFFFIKI